MTKKIILPLLRKLRFFFLPNQNNKIKFNICSDKIIWQHPPIQIYPIPDMGQTYECMYVLFKNATSKYLKYRPVTWKINFSPKWKRKGAGDNKHAVPNSFNCFLFLSKNSQCAIYIRPNSLLFEMPHLLWLMGTV